LASLVWAASTGNLTGGLHQAMGIGICGSTFLTTRLLRLDENNRARTEQLFATYGIWEPATEFGLPVIGDPLCVVAGVMKVGFGRFAMSRG